jgi:hypothetical protein
MLVLDRVLGHPYPRPSLFPVPPAWALSRPFDLEGGALAEALVCETQTAALQTAVVTSALNALRHPGRLETPTEIKNFVPHQPPAIMAARAWLADLELAPATIETVEVFFQELRPARAQLDRLFSEAAEIGFERAEIIHRSQLAASWQVACRGAIDAVRSLDRALRFSLPERYAESVPVLVSLLNSSADGLQPCVDLTGRPFMPELPQRRRSARKGLFQECKVQHARRTVSALVRDISTGGLGLEGIAELRPADMVIVDLACGRRLLGRVVWVKGRLSGVRFSTPLPPNDPLLFG